MSVPLHAPFEQANHVSIVGILSEAKLSAVVHVLLELFGVTLAQLIHSDFQLLLLDVIVLFVLASPRKALPGETPSQEIEEHMADGLQVISSRLFIANVGVDAGISCRACEVLALSERNVLSLRVLVAFGQAEVNDEDRVLVVVRASNEEVVWLDVSMDDPFFMHLLDSRH